MVKMKNKNILFILGAIVLIVIFARGNFTSPGTQAAVDITDAQLTRTFDKASYDQGENIVVTYTPSGANLASGSWGYLVDDQIVVGDCTPARYSDGVTASSIVEGTLQRTFVAGTNDCTFSGTVQFSSGAQTGTEQAIITDNDVITILDCVTLRTDATNAISLWAGDPDNDPLRTDALSKIGQWAEFC